MIRYEIFYNLNNNKSENKIIIISVVSIIAKKQKTKKEYFLKGIIMLSLVITTLCIPRIKFLMLHGSPCSEFSVKVFDLFTFL